MRLSEGNDIAVLIFASESSTGAMSRVEGVRFVSEADSRATNRVEGKWSIVDRMHELLCQTVM